MAPPTSERGGRANDRGAAANGGADVGAASGERVAGESGPGEAGATANGAANVAGEAGAATGDTNDRGVAAIGPPAAALRDRRGRALRPARARRGLRRVRGRAGLHDELPMPFERARRCSPSVSAFAAPSGARKRGSR